MSTTNVPPVLESKGLAVLVIAGLIATVGIGGAVLGIGPMGDAADPAPQAQDQTGTEVTLQPGSESIVVDETATYDVVVENANGGVGAYDFTVSVDDPSVASITDVTAQGNPGDQTTDVSIAGDGSSATVQAALADTSDSGTVAIATVTVRGDAAGTSDLGLSVNALGTEAGESYDVTGTASASITVETPPEPDPANFEVSDLDAPQTATQGDEIDVSAEISNDGGQQATQTVEFRLGSTDDGALDSDNAIVSQEVTLDADESQTVQFSDLNTSGLDAGGYTHGVFTDDDSETATIAIEAPPDPDPPEQDPDPEPDPEPAEFDASDLDAPDSAIKGDTIDVSADITNDGDRDDTQTVEFRIDLDGDGTLQSDEVLATEEIAVDGGDTETVQFEELDTSNLDAREYTHGVFTDDDYETATITVEEPEPEPAPGITVGLQPESERIDAGETATYDVVVQNVDGGVGAYDFTVSVGDASVASITDVAAQGNPSGETTDISITEDGSSADVMAALADTSDSGSVAIATVTIEGDADGTSDLGLSVDALGTEAGESYDVSETTGASVTVESEQEPEPANFAVGITDTNSPVVEGDSIEVTALIENTGETEATRDIELDVGELGTDSVSVTLDGDEKTTKTLNVETEAGDAGEYTARMSTGDDTDSTTVSATERDEEPVYWQVDFSADAAPPEPPSYWPDDLMAALGNSDDGVTQNPSLLRQSTDGQLGDVTIVDDEFKFDDEGNPTAVTVEFEIDEDGAVRDLHLASFTLPGPFDEDEIDQQELFDSTSGTYEGGDTGELTVSIPQEGDD